MLRHQDARPPLNIDVAFMSNYDNQVGSVECSATGIASEDDMKELRQFTVIGIYRNTRQIYADLVDANSMSHAFFVSAQGVDDPSNIDFVCAMPAVLQEGENIEYAGCDVVDGATILEQEDVFNSTNANEMREKLLEA